LSNADKGAVGLIPALELASLTVRKLQKSNDSVTQGYEHDSTSPLRSYPFNLLSFELSTVCEESITWKWDLVLVDFGYENCLLTPWHM